jgi:membrane dipeptidase
MMLRQPLSVLFLLATTACAGVPHGHSHSQAGAHHPETAAPTDFATRAQKLAQEFIIVDGHIDVPYRLESSKSDTGALTEDVSHKTHKGDFDYPRAVKGGLNAPFMSIYIPARYQEEGSAKKVADGLIDMVETMVQATPEKFQIARSPADVRRHKQDGVMSLPLGIENGAAIEDDLANVGHFYNRGVRYITLTHSKDNQICDSSYDERHTHKGLTPFGEKVVAEMNRLGIMVDISHVSDDAFFQVMKISKVPAIASHSSARHFTPGFERNMSDEMIQLLAKNGGIIMINFGSTFISQPPRDASNKRRAAINAFKDPLELEWNDPKVVAFKENYDKLHPRVFADVTDVADHIDHVVKLAGVDAVGLGSDFDGVGDSLPTKLKDVSMFPNLIEELLKRGYSEKDIDKICGQNALRVWKAVEDFAKSQTQSK